MASSPFPVDGLNDAEVLAARSHHGRNTLEDRSRGVFWPAVKGTVTEPMFVLLLATSVIYFLLGERAEALFMGGAIVLVSAISFYQDSRSRSALAALQALSESKAKVLRGGIIVQVPVEEVVVGDHAIAEEGSLIAADGRIVQSNDFSVNESILTGEPFAVPRSADDPEQARVSKGTQVVSGLALYRVTAVGKATRLGRISTTLAQIVTPPTPLQRQIRRFVRNMAVVGVFVFLLVWGINFLRTGSLLGSLLNGLTLAMSILPEEIPVAFSTFLALGAWRLSRAGVIVKSASTVETLGSATVLCTDKTGTITENRMALAQLYIHSTRQVAGSATPPGADARRVIEVAMWASEPVPFDPMEVALHAAYAGSAERDRRPDFRMEKEYPLGGTPPMMTHVFVSAAGERILACKGAPERILRQSSLTDEEKQVVIDRVDAFAREGLRVLGVAEARRDGSAYPEDQSKFTLEFLGLAAFNDPAKVNISEVLAQFYAAGIEVKIITGDNALTTAAIARQTGFRGAERTLSGEELLTLDDGELRRRVQDTAIFTRMFPEAKLRIIDALKEAGQVVAMTGDGVNDGPALKAAHIGIAMGRRGSDLAKEAAALILTDDDLGRMVDAVAMGRRIYANLKKAIQYIISIHIPIIVTVSLPLFLGWIYPNIFTPVHVIFLELIMGPTCSIVYENEPLERDGMRQPPRPIGLTFLSWRELSVSVWQGLAISAGTLASYRIALHLGPGEDLVRSMVFTTLVIANIGLTLVNRSFTDSFLRAFRYRNVLLRGMLGATLLLLFALLYIPILRAFFRLEALSAFELALCTGIGLASVLWLELYKWIRRLSSGALTPASLPAMEGTASRGPRG